MCCDFLASMETFGNEFARAGANSVVVIYLYSFLEQRVQYMSTTSSATETAPSVVTTGAEAQSTPASGASTATQPNGASSAASSVSTQPGT